jgi:hypothetical protein
LIGVFRASIGVFRALIEVIWALIGVNACVETKPIIAHEFGTLGFVGLNAGSAFKWYYSRN